MSRYFLDNNVRQWLVRGIEKLRRSVNSTLFCVMGPVTGPCILLKLSSRFRPPLRSVLNISLDLVDCSGVARLHSLSIPVFKSYISRTSSLFIDFAAASFRRDRSAIHFDRWPRVRLVFQDSGLQLRTLRINRAPSSSLFFSPGKLSRLSLGSSFRFVRIRGRSICETFSRSIKHKHASPVYTIFTRSLPADHATVVGHICLL